MAALYPGTSVSGYNSNPPPDDGSTGSTNLITWNTDVKAKIGDPLNTFASSVDSNITGAFGKTFDGAAVSPQGVNYQVLAGDQGKLITATASGITITTPDATAVGAPFVFAINNQSSGTITLAGKNPGVQQNVDGSASQTIQQGGSCIVKTDGSNWFTVGLKSGGNSLSGSNYGFTDPVNLQLVASSISGNTLLQIAIKTKAGNDPSPSDPVLIPFRDATLTGGDPVWVTLSSALNMNTNAVGATLGTQNGVSFRFWVVAFNNGGTVVLALWQSGSGSSPIAINPLNEGTLQSTTGISAAATSAGVFYTPNGTTLSNKAFRILGYLEYNSLATAGTYATAPNIVQLFGPGIKKPGDEVQRVYSTQTSNANTTSTTFTTTGSNVSASITPTSVANLIDVLITGPAGNATSTDGAAIAVFRGSSTQIGVGNGAVGGAVALSVYALDAPGLTSSITYNMAIRAITGSTANFNSTAGASSGTSILVRELMG